MVSLPPAGTDQRSILIGECERLCYGSWEATTGFSTSGVTQINAAEDAPSPYAFDCNTACVPGPGTNTTELLQQPCAPASPRPSHDIEGDNSNSLLLSPRAYDSLDSLPTENLNSVSLTNP